MRTWRWYYETPCSSQVTGLFRLAQDGGLEVSFGQTFGGHGSFSRRFQVSLYETPGAKQPRLFECNADDAEGARKEAEYSFPCGEVLDVIPVDDWKPFVWAPPGQDERAKELTFKSVEEVETWFAGKEGWSLVRV